MIAQQSKRFAPGNHRGDGKIWVGDGKCSDNRHA